MPAWSRGRSKLLRGTIAGLRSSVCHLGSGHLGEGPDPNLEQKNYEACSPYLSFPFLFQLKSNQARFRVILLSLSCLVEFQV